MKIIFDSEEEKMDFLIGVRSCLVNCPSDIGLACECEYDCDKCWEQAIETEVARE